MPVGKTIEILTSGERRRRWSNEDKRQLVLATLAPGGSVASVARGCGVSQSLLYAWRREVLTGALTQSATPAPAFVAVEVAPAEACGQAAPAAEAGIVEVVLRNGRTLRVAAGVAAETLVRLAAALERP